MRILFSVHLWAPRHNCGGEYFCINLSNFLISRGHEVRVLLHQANQHKITQFYDWSGATIFPPGCNEGLLNWCDIILTHLEFTNWSIQMGRIFKKPVAYISHNTGFKFYDCVKDNPQVGVIYNCDAMKAQSPWTNPSFVLHPAIDPEKIVRPTGDYITMINCNENKGGKILCRLAAAMPERKFLAVKGSYEEQFIPNLPNVTIRENGPDIKPVYEQTRILLMPSRYESWGMTATEAMACGIPVIACPTFGLKENLSYAGIFVPERGDIDDDLGTDDGDSYDIWPIIEAIRMLDKPKEHRRWQELCRRRMAEFDQKKELENCEKFLLTL